MKGVLRAQAIREYKSIKIILDSDVFIFSLNSKKLDTLKFQADELKKRYNL